MIDRLHQSLQRIASFFRRAQLDHDLDSEMASHRELAIEENLRAGMPPDEARRQALVNFGGLEQTKESVRDARTLPFLETLLQDLRYVANTPEQYTVQVNTGAVTEYDVPHDDRIKIGIPSYRPSCGVYLVNAIKVRGYGDALNGWTVSITRDGKTVRKQSLRVTQKSPTDESGYHMVRIGQ